MRIYNEKAYKVVKYDLKADTTSDYGILTGADVKSVIGSAKYDEEYGMFFTAKANIGYDITEA